MMHIFYSLLFIFSSQLFAFEKEFDANVREDGKLKSKKVILKDLISENSFDGEFFTIVKADSTAPIRFDEEQDLVFKAATAYYHLTLARNYYKTLSIEGAKLDDKHVIRIEQDKQYSDVIHMKGEKYSQANGALTIDGSNPEDAEEGYFWNREIWFFEKKPVKRPTAVKTVSKIVNNRQFKNALMGEMLLQDLLSVTNTLMTNSMNSYRLEAHLMSMAYSIGIVELIPRIFTVAGVFKETYYLDTVLIPEIIHHEYGHIALGHIFGYKTSSPLNEGFPNFFAYKISNQKKLGGNKAGIIKGSQAKNAKSQSTYSMREDFASEAAFGSFTFSLLYQLEQGLGDEALAILIESLKFIDQDSDLKVDFPRAVKRAIDRISKNPNAQKMNANLIFKKKGI